MKKLFLCTALLSAITFKGQITYTHQWSKVSQEVATGVGSVENVAVLTDDNNDVITVGNFQGTVDLDLSSTTDVNLVSSGSRDIFIAKYSAAGALLFATKFGGTGDDVVTDMAINGYDIYICGAFNGTANFGTAGNKTSNGSSDAYVAKIAQFPGSFTVNWAKTFGGSGSDAAYALSEGKYLAASVVWVTGAFSNTVDFDPEATTVNKTSNGLTDMFMSSFDKTSGTYYSTTHSGGTGYDAGIDIVSTTTNAYVTGYFNGTVNFGYSGNPINKTSYGDSDIFVNNYDTNGLPVWIKTMGGAQDDYGYSIDLDASGNVYSVGTYMGTASLNPLGGNNLTSAGFSDGYISKLTSAGAYVFGYRFGGTGYDTPKKMDVTSTGQCFITGTFANTFNYNGMSTPTSTLLAYGNSDMFLLQTDLSGNFNYVAQIGGASDDSGNWVYKSNAGNVYLGGAFMDAADFDFTNIGLTYYTANAMVKNGFISKYNYCGISAASILPTTTLTACRGQAITLNANSGFSTYTWSLSAFTSTLQNATYTVPAGSFNTTLNFTATVTDANGCIGKSILAVSVYTNPAVTATSANALSCVGNNVVLNTSVVSGTTYLWQGPSSYTSAIPNSTLTNVGVGASGVYSVMATSPQGCSKTATVNITVNNLPNLPIITPTAPAVCSGSSVNYTVTGGGNVSWYATATSTNAIWNGTFNNFGTYTTGVTSSTVAHYASTTNTTTGCTSLRAAIIATINALPSPPTNTTGNDTLICYPNNTATLSAAATGTLSWYAAATGGTVLAIGNTYAITTATVANNYYYYVGLTDNNGCVSGTRTEIQVNKLQQFSPPGFIGNSGTCAGSTATITASNSGGLTINWYATATSTTVLSNSNPFTTPTLTSSTTFFATQSYGHCESLTRSSKNVTVSQIPAMPICTTTSLVACQNVGILLQFDNYYNFYNAAVGGTNLGSGSQINIATPAIGIFTYYAEAIGGYCPNSPRTAVTVTVNLCLPTGILVNQLLNAITLQPNPAATKFTLNNVVVGSTLAVIDITGKIVLTKTLNDVNETIETIDLANGIYVIQLQNNGAVAHKKLIISK